MKAGEEKDIDITFPENYTPELAGKPVVFHVKVNEVKHKEVPAIDDEFVPVVFPLFKLTGQSAAIAAALAVTSFVMIPLHAYSISAVTGVLRAGGDVAWSAALDIAPQWLLALPLTALLALVFKANYWFIAAAIQAESLLKVPLCALRIRTGKWIHDVTLPQGEL